jgi:MraZ protein
MDHSFSGNALCAVDTDGFVRLPDFVRTALGRRSDSNRLMMAPHGVDSCLVGYDRDHSHFLLAEQERLRLNGDDAGAHHARARRIFGWVEEGAYETDGRISLPARMRARAKVEDLALFIGAGNLFEIWNPQVALDSSDEALSEIAAWRCQTNIPPAPGEN